MKPATIAAVIFTSLGLLLAGSLNGVQAANSTNFEIRDAQTGPSQFRSSSGNYTIDGSIEAIVRNSESGNYKIEGGSPTRIDPVVSGGGGGGGNTGAVCTKPGPLGVDNFECTRVYKNLVQLSGSKTEDTVAVAMNGDISGMHFSDPTHWDKVVALTQGNNVFDIIGYNDCGNLTDTIRLILEKVKMGDINNNGSTDDYDLSLLTRKWNQAKDCFTDFNRDQVTDDYDLSLMASAWG